MKKRTIGINLKLDKPISTELNIALGILEKNKYAKL